MRGKTEKVQQKENKRIVPFLFFVGIYDPNMLMVLHNIIYDTSKGLNSYSYMVYLILTVIPTKGRAI